MTIDFTKGNFVVYESKTEKGKEEVEKLTYFSDYEKARRHMALRLKDEVYETESVCGYAPEDIQYFEDPGDGLKDCGAIIKDSKTGKNILILSLFVHRDMKSN